MDSLENLIFTELISNNFFAVAWNTLCLKFLNNGLTLQAPGYKLSSKIIFKLVLTKSFSQNVSDLMLKILLPLVIKKPFMCLLWFYFFPILAKLRSCCLIKISQPSEHCLAKDISKPLAICITIQSKCHQWGYTLEFVT